MKKFSLYISFILSAIISIALTLWACGYVDLSEKDNSMFAPEIITNKKYTPFFRSTASSFYDGNYSDYVKAHNEINVEEWNQFFSKKINVDSLKFWLYNSKLEEIDAMIFKLQGKSSNLSPQATKNSLSSVQPKEKALSFLYYIGFAKRTEAYSTKQIYQWDEDTNSKPIKISAQKLIESAKKQLSKEKSNFVRERYIFQITRLYYYSNKVQDGIQFYKEQEKNFTSKNSMKWRTMGYAAGLYKMNSDLSTANYLYSLIFANHEIGKKSAYLSFLPSNDADWSRTLSLAQNKEERIVLWTMFGIKNDLVRAISELYKLNPKSSYLELLLVRGVNIEESNFTETVFLKYYGKKTNADKKVDQKLIDLISKIANVQNTSNPELWNLAAAYLNYATKKFSKGDEFLSKIQNTEGTDLNKVQFRMIRLFGKLYRTDSITKNVEDDILDDIKVVFAVQNKDIPHLRFYFAQNWIRNHLAVLYALANNFEKAEIIQPRTTFKNYDINTLNKILAYIDAKNHSPLEKFFLGIAQNPKVNYLELLGIRYTQSDELEMALKTFQKIPNYNKKIDGDPFSIHIKDCHDCDHAVAKEKYTTISLIQKMISLKKEIVANKNLAQNYFLLGNAFYNISYFGNARKFYGNSIQDFLFYFLDYDDKTSGDTNALELDNIIVQKHYTLAEQNSNDPEFKAKLTFMLAKTEQNQWFMNRPKGYLGNFKSGKYFKILKENYSDTDYYADIIKECGHFATYDKLHK